LDHRVSKSNILLADDLLTRLSGNLLNTGERFRLHQDPLGSTPGTPRTPGNAWPESSGAVSFCLFQARARNDSGSPPGRSPPSPGFHSVTASESSNWNFSLMPRVK